MSKVKGECSFVPYVFQHHMLQCHLAEPAVKKNHNILLRVSYYTCKNIKSRKQEVKLIFPLQLGSDNEQFAPDAVRKEKVI